MINNAETNETIVRDFEEIIKAAEENYPGLTKEFEVFTSGQVEMESFFSYLELMYETPTVVTANQAT
ncbi:MAG: hypothetical protein KF685_01540 [Acidobacteria bacterium]|nr:hypothetical protein [Acidobacteriota bacterium]